jgi:hypothetical protein
MIWSGVWEHRLTLGTAGSRPASKAVFCPDLFPRVAREWRFRVFLDQPVGTSAASECFLPVGRPSRIRMLSIGSGSSAVSS